MTSPLRNSISWNEAKMLTGFATVLLTFAGAWFSLISNQALTNQKLDNLTSRMSNIQQVQMQTSINVAKLQQVIDDARARGLFSGKLSSTYALLTYLR